MYDDRILRIYTDGGCAGNQKEKNTGGWGAILEFGDARKELYGRQRNTTNNRMEMTALIEALKAVKKPGQTIYVFSDSSYLMDCFRKKWYVNWMKNGWKTAGKKPVENQELWRELLKLIEGHNMEFFRVKGHVNLESTKVDSDALYDKFTEWNGTNFSYEDFCYVTEQNNRADELANIAMKEINSQE